MKTTILHIFILFALFMVFSSRSCVPEDEGSGDQDLTVKHDSIIRVFKDHFGSDYLTDEQLMLFGEKGKQKVIDFIDLLNIYLDPVTDSIFGNHVLKMLLKDFLQSEAPISLWPDGQKGSIPVYNWIEEIKRQPYWIKYNVENLKITEPFHPVGPEMYKGALTAKISIVCISGNDTVYTEKSGRLVSLAVTKTKKLFGNNDYQDVWQVFLNGVE